MTLLDPMTGKDMISIPNTTENEIQPFIDSIKNTPKSGLHNPFKNKERYVMLGGGGRDGGRGEGGLLSLADVG